jgi:hypothetical protein
MTNFKARLEEAGYTNGADHFFQSVSALFATHFPGQTDEQLKRHPREALRFCDTVRTTLGIPELSDDLILGALENYRKHRKRLSKTA